MSDKDKVTRRKMIEHTISQAINQWLHQKGEDVFKYVNYIDRVCEMQTDAIRPAIERAEKLWHEHYGKPIFAEDKVPKYSYQEWKDIGMLEGVSEEDGVELAIILEQQRLSNKKLDEWEGELKRVSLPIIRRVFKGLLDMGIKVKGSTKKLPKWHPLGYSYAAQQDGHAQSILAAEAQNLASLAEKFVEDLAAFAIDKQITLRCMRASPVVLDKDTFCPKKNFLINYDVEGKTNTNES